MIFTTVIMILYMYQFYMGKVSKFHRFATFIIYNELTINDKLANMVVFIRAKSAWKLSGSLPKSNTNDCQSFL